MSRTLIDTTTDLTIITLQEKEYQRYFSLMELTRTTIEPQTLLIK